MDPTKLDPGKPEDAVRLIDIATETLAGPNAGSRSYAVAVQVALNTLRQLASEAVQAQAAQKQDAAPAPVTTENPSA